MRKVLEVLFANQAELQALIVECGDDQVSPAARLLQHDAAAPTRPSSASSCHLHCHLHCHLPPATSAAAKEDDPADPGPAEGPCGSDAGGGLPGSAYGCAAPRPCAPRPCAGGGSELPVTVPPGTAPSFLGEGLAGGEGRESGLPWERAHCAPLANPWRRLSRAQASCRV